MMNNAINTALNTYVCSTPPIKTPILIIPADVRTSINTCPKRLLASIEAISSPLSVENTRRVVKFSELHSIRVFLRSSVVTLHEHH